MVIIHLLVGALLWSFLEYVFHRFLGHGAIKTARANLFGVEHTRHHSVGDYFAPTWKKATFALLLTALFLPVTGWAFTLGFVVSYLGYELVHRRAHTHAGIGPYARYLRRHHFHHHFMNPRANHGVSSPVWDFVFGTLELPARTRVPRKLAMRWLVDPSTGGVQTTFSQDYELAG